MRRILSCAAVGVLAVAVGWAAQTTEPDAPRAADARLQVDLFAASPDIVHPIGLDFDARGRLLVVESHTHFPPAGYKGPPHDRVRVLEDTDGDGRADRFTTFFEGTRKTMDIAAGPDGWVYLATRSEVLRVRDTDGDGKADEKQRVVFLDTAGDYPHNGLSGLAFDSQGNLYFGMGENLGAGYKLIGSDGRTIAGGGEGGNVFWCTPGGKGLRRVATGFWNPFGVCRDAFGRLFAVDNDPDSMPPCRMVHLVEGGDYGYQFRYGRAGRHPFQCWDGQLPGTLPMLAGTGEAPVEVLAYESDALPREYLGNLLVTSWADHRVERYVLKERGASYTAQRQPFVQGGKDFRPSGMALAPDGSLFVGDWVKSDYTLHGKGAVWHIRPREAVKHDRPRDARQALLSAHRPLRDAAARELAQSEKGRSYLREQLTGKDERVRAASLTALTDNGDRQTDLGAVAEKDPQIALRAMAVRALAGRGKDTSRFLDAREPAVRLEAVAGLRGKGSLPRLLQLLVDADPFVRSAAIRELGRSPDLLADIERRSLGPRMRMGVLLAYRASGTPEATRLIPEFLADPDEEVRFLAAKWVADERLVEFRPLLAEALKDRKLNVRLFSAYSTALARIDGKEVNEGALAEYFFDRLADDHTPPALRVMALQMVPPSHPKLTPELLDKLAHQEEPALRLEAVRALAEHPSPRRIPLLRAVADDERMDDAVRAQAILGLAERAQDLLDDLLRLARVEKATRRDEALRALVGTRLSDSQREQLEQLARRRPECAALVARVLGKPPAKDRPPTEDVKAWLARLEGPADADAGRRVFAHPKLAGCYRCHRAEGRGRVVGPDLSTIGQTERRHILESILQPSANVAPHYQVWEIETRDGKVRAGMLVGTNLDEYTYLDAQGSLFKVNTRDVAESRAVPTSIMPAGMADLMTDQELRDLLAYLCSRR
jgi:putative membrane-bound dehydrogenase-like protein